MKLYEFGKSRSIRCLWAFNELGAPFEAIRVNLGEREQDSAAFRALNPSGKVPVLVDGDFVLTESAAILSYIADKYPEKSLIPKAGTQARAIYDQWMFFGMCELEAPLWVMEKHTWFYPDEMRAPLAIESAKSDFLSSVKVLDAHMANREFILGEAFSVCDILFGHLLAWSHRRGLLENFPHVLRYKDKLLARPAFPKERYV